MKLLLTSNLTLAGSEFHTVCAATENAQHTYYSCSCERRRDHISIAIPTTRLVFRYE